MSTRRVKKFVRTFNVTSSSFLAGVTTFNVASAHYLTTGDLVTIRTPKNPIIINNVAVTVTSATAFTIPTPFDYHIQEDGEIQIDFYATGQTGGQQSITVSNVTGSPIVVQAYVKGTGGAVYTIEGSLDNAHWTVDTSGTITHTAVNDNTQAAIITPAWPYLRINLTSVGAATKLYVSVSS